MGTGNEITGWRELMMRRQCLAEKTAEEGYNRLYDDLSPGLNVYWNGFGDPPSLTFRACFDDIAYNRKRMFDRRLLKGRFQGGNIGFVTPEIFNVMACAYIKPLDSPTPVQSRLLELIRREGPMNIGLMKEMTGLLVKDITPALHRLQEAFLVFEDQYDGEWDRGWHMLSEIHPEIDLNAMTRTDALKRLIPGFAYRHVRFNLNMAKSYFKLPIKDLTLALDELTASGELLCDGGVYALGTASSRYVPEDTGQALPGSVFAMHRNDFLVKSYDFELKERFKTEGFDTLQYLLIDGEFRGAVVGKFKNGPYIIEDIVTDLPYGEAEARRDEILEAVYAVNSRERSPVKRYLGQNL